MFEHVILISLALGQMEMERVFGPCEVVRREVSSTYRRTTKTCRGDTALDIVEDIKNGKVIRNESSIYGDFSNRKITVPGGCTSSKSKIAVTIVCK